MTDLTKTKEKEHMVTNRLTLNRQEERGCAETVVAPTVHLLIAQLVAWYFCTARSQTILLMFVDQKPEDNEFIL